MKFPKALVNTSVLILHTYLANVNLRTLINVIKVYKTNRFTTMVNILSAALL